MTETLAQKKFAEYGRLSEDTGTLVKMSDGHEVEVVRHVNEKIFYGRYDDLRYDHHEYSFKYENIESVIVHG